MHTLPSMIPTAFVLVAAGAASACAASLPRGTPSPEVRATLGGAWVAPDSTEASVRAQFAAQHPSPARIPNDSVADEGEDTDEVLVGLPGFVRPQYEPGDWTDADEALAATEVARRVPERLRIEATENHVRIEGIHVEPMTLPYRGRDVIVTAAGLEVRVKALWEGDVLLVRRSFGRARIEDRLRVDGPDDRLLVTRTVVNGRLDFELDVAYDRR